MLRERWSTYRKFAGQFANGYWAIIHQLTKNGAASRIAERIELSRFVRIH